MKQENSCDGNWRQSLGSLLLISNVGVRSHLTSASFLPSPPPFSLRNRDKDLVSFLGSVGRSVDWFFRLNEGYLQLYPHLTRKWPVGLWDWHSKIHATSRDGALYGHLHRLCGKWSKHFLLSRQIMFLT